MPRHDCIESAVAVSASVHVGRATRARVRAAVVAVGTTVLVAGCATPIGVKRLP